MTDFSHNFLYLYLLYLAGPSQYSFLESNSMDREKEVVFLLLVTVLYDMPNVFLPGCPVRHKAKPVVVLTNDSFVFVELLSGVSDQHWSSSFQKVIAEIFILYFGFGWQEGGRPNLAVRVRVGAAHDSSLVLKDLDPSVLLA